MNYLFKISLAVFIATFTYSSVEAFPVENENFCQIKVRKSGQRTFMMLVPENKVKSILKEFKGFELMYVDCRSQIIKSQTSDSTGVEIDRQFLEILEDNDIVPK